MTFKITWTQIDKHQSIHTVSILTTNWNKKFKVDNIYVTIADR